MKLNRAGFFGVFALLTLLAVGCGTREKVEPADVVEMREAVSNEVDLWPGFDPDVIPLAIWDGKKTHLFRHPAPPEEFEPVGDGSDHWVMEGRTEGLVANSSMVLRGAPTATIMLDLKKMSVREWAAVATHESFHVFQAANREDWFANVVTLLSYPDEDVPVLAAKHMEEVALRNALRAEDEAAKAAWAKTAVVAREEREELLNEDVSTYEARLEAHEGTAHYVEGRVLGSPLSKVLKDIPFGPDQIRKRYYSTGHAYALLLDTFNPFWKESFKGEQMPVLHELLKEALAENPETPAGFDVEELTDFTKEAAAQVTSFKRARQKALDSFSKKQGWTFKIEIAGDVPLFVNGFDPMNYTKVDNETFIHHRFLNLVHPRGKFEMMNREGLTVASSIENPLFGAVQMFMCTGLKDEPKIEVNEDKTVITFDGFKGVFVNAHVEKEGVGVTVVL